MSSTTRKKAAALKTGVAMVATSSGMTFGVVPNFAMFIDTHRDQPHIPSFEDLHRGMTKPTLVHYVPPKDTDPPEHMGALIRVEDGSLINVHPKHRFLEVDWWTKFVTDWVMEHGTSPTPTSGEYKGQLPTSHLRDARRRVYHLKSLRQIVRAHEKASSTATGTVRVKTPSAITLARRAARAARAARTRASILAAFPPLTTPKGKK